MASREALRTQLDALQAELNAVEVENRRLREDHPERVAVLEAGQELESTREENARLARRSWSS